MLASLFWHNTAFSRVANRRDRFYSKTIRANNSWTFCFYYETAQCNNITVLCFGKIEDVQYNIEKLRAKLSHKIELFFYQNH